MNYGVQTETTEGSGDAPQPAAPTSSDYENYLKYYHEAGQDRMLGRPKKDVVKEDTHDEMVEKLQQLESSIQQGTLNVVIEMVLLSTHNIMFWKRNEKFKFYAPNFEKVEGAYCFGLVRPNKNEARGFKFHRFPIKK